MDQGDQRYYFIELLCYWEGRVNATHIANQFNLSQAQAADALKRYRCANPNCLEYNSSAKAHRPTPQFNPSFISRDVHEYLTWFASGQLEPSYKDYVHVLRLPERQLEPLTLRAIVEAVRKGLRVDVEYRSFKQPAGEGRVIAPHAFVNTGGRWHVRAFCEQSGLFKDFVLSRFSGESLLMDASPNRQQDDQGWNTWVTLNIAPDPRLSSERRAILAQDYQITGDYKALKVRGCLVNYWLRELQISPKTLDANPVAQQLICTNLDELKPWLFEG